MNNLTGTEKIEELITSILGRSAFNNSMRVDTDVSKICNAIIYLAIQIKITGRWIEDEQGKHHIEQVLEETIKILKV